MTRYLLDTNTCVDHLRDQHAGKLVTRLEKGSSGTILLCAVVVAELVYGAWRSADPVSTLTKVREFCRGLQSLPFENAAAEEYGRIRAELAQAGTPIGPNDLMIAAIALANQLTLVTNNVAEFSRVRRLQIEKWE